VLIGLDLSTQSTTRFCSSACRLSSEWNTPLTWLRSYLNGQLSTVCENWSATVNCYPAWGQYPTRVSTGSGPILFSHQMTKSLRRWLPVQHQITYKFAVLAYKVQTKSMPAYLSCHIKLRDTVWTLRSPTTNWFSEIFSSTAFANSAMCNPLFWSGHLQLTATH